MKGGGLSSRTWSFLKSSIDAAQNIELVKNISLIKLSEFRLIIVVIPIEGCSSGMEAPIKNQ